MVRCLVMRFQELHFVVMCEYLDQIFANSEKEDKENRRKMFDRHGRILFWIFSQDIIKT
jgi:hypothetical protein